MEAVGGGVEVELHMGSEAEAMQGTQVWWSRRDSKAALVEGWKTETGLHYGNESGSMQEAVQM